MVNLHSFANGMVCASYVLTAIVCAIGLRVLVARAKKCWDFGSTIYILHFGATCLVGGFPWSWFWWAVMITCTAITILVGELLCVRYEMADIPMKGASCLDFSSRCCCSIEVCGMPMHAPIGRHGNMLRWLLPSVVVLLGWHVIITAVTILAGRLLCVRYEMAVTPVKGVTPLETDAALFNIEPSGSTTCGGDA
jgi:hypothetical protein